MENGNGDLRRSGGGSATTAFSGQSYKRYKIENETPSFSGSTMVIRLNPGAAAYFILNQLEEGPFCTSEILTDGAAAVREADTLLIQNLDTKPFFNPDEGMIAMRVTVYKITKMDSINIC